MTTRTETQSLPPYGRRGADLSKRGRSAPRRDVSSRGDRRAVKSPPRGRTIRVARVGPKPTVISRSRLTPAALPLALLVGCAAAKYTVQGALPTRTAPARVNPAAVLDADPDWKAANAEVYQQQAQLDAQEARLVGTGLDRFVLRRGVGLAKRVSLTFDDGPHPQYTPKLLDLLKAKGVRATFFVIGHMADKYPDLVKRIAAEGHEVANHTYSHVTLPRIQPEEIDVEYQANNDVIRRLTGKPARYCRPPGGDYNLEVLRRAASLGLTTVLWTDDPGDYDNPGDGVLFSRETTALSPGGIILLHDGSRDTIDTLGAFIDAARAQGYTFVSLDDLRKAPATSNAVPSRTVPSSPAPSIPPPAPPNR
ncbi:polysaccharide deacetylase family protein [bacterium]|nr:MAG: polysaccharide deacetylase family protein [bacterium]